MVNVWAPLVPTTKRNGCLRLIPGSHKWDQLGSLLPKRNSTWGYLEVDTDQQHQQAHEVLDIELDPGDVLLFKQKLIHSGNPNVSDGIRWSIDWRYQNARLHTLKDEQGDISRSRLKPDAVVRDGHHWATLPIWQGAKELNYVSTAKILGIMRTEDVAVSRLNEEGCVRVCVRACVCACVRACVCSRALANAATHVAQTKLMHAPAICDLHPQIANFEFTVCECPVLFVHRPRLTNLRFASRSAVTCA
jgi:hypothetical protein